MRIVISNKERLPTVRPVDCELEIHQPAHLPEIIVEVDKKVLDARPDYSLARILVEDAQGRTARIDLTLRINEAGRVVLQTVGHQGGDGIGKVAEEVTAVFRA